MSKLALKPSRIRAIQDIDNLARETKEVFSEYEEQRRHRIRLARKARQLANKVRKRYPDMRLPNGMSLHEHVEDLAQALYTPNNSKHDEVFTKIDSRFERLFWLLNKLTDVPWLDPLG